MQVQDQWTRSLNELQHIEASSLHHLPRGQDSAQSSQGLYAPEQVFVAEPEGQQPEKTNVPPTHLSQHATQFATEILRKSGLYPQAPPKDSWTTRPILRWRAPLPSEEEAIDRMRNKEKTIDRRRERKKLMGSDSDRRRKGGLPDHYNYTVALRRLIGDFFSEVERPDGAFEFQLAQAAAGTLVHEIEKAVEEARNQGTSDSRIQFFSDFLEKLGTKRNSFNSSREAIDVRQRLKGKNPGDKKKGTEEP